MHFFSKIYIIKLSKLMYYANYPGEINEAVANKLEI